MTAHTNMKYMLVLLVPLTQYSKDKKRMPLNVTNTRYSLVKGERIVRFVFITQLRAFITPSCSHL